jgi:hypothetical protein
MPLSKNNVIFVYNANSADSEDVAQYYAAFRELDITSVSDPSNTGTTGGIDWEVKGQLVAISITDSSEILSSEALFNTQVLNPLKYALEHSAELLNRTIWCIILGYNVPGGFRSGDNIISSTSRISRIFHTFNKKLLNKLYNRSIFSRFNASDAEISLICSRIDLDTVLTTKNIIDRAQELNDKLFIDGTFYIDPYSDKVGVSADKYKTKILDFYETILPSLNLDTWSTIFMDPYIDSNIPYVENDSFVWSWFTSRGSNSFFKTTTSPRVFFYNADYDGGYTVKGSGNKRWPSLSLHKEYVSSAGSLSNPTAGGFLDPSPFFNALLRGGTIGEAFLYSTPYLDWTIALFGDPLATCSFPSAEVVEEETISTHDLWYRMSKDLARTVAEFYKRGQELEEVQTAILNMTSTTEESSIDLLYSITDLLKLSNATALKSVFKSLIESLFDFPIQKYQNSSYREQTYTLDTYLTEHQFKLSTILTDAVGVTSTISSANLLDEGWWQFEFELEDQSTNFVYYHFILEVSAHENFYPILFTKDSVSITNWTYEQSKDNFVVLPLDGVSTSYVGRRIRYESRVDPLISLNEYLTRGETYYFRVTQYDADTGAHYVSENISSGIIESTDIIYS